MNEWLLRRAAVAPGTEVDLAIAGERIVEPGSLSAAREELDLGGRVAIAGLVDQHIHVRSLAASWRSVDCSPAALQRAGGLAAALGTARARDPDGWLRGVGYDPSGSGVLDRNVLDATGAGPVRVQDRSGVTWTLDSSALATVLDADPTRWPDGVELDAAANPTGRLYRLDAWLAGRVPRLPLDLASVGRWLAARGVTSLVDASFTNGADELTQLANAGLPQRVIAMTGEPDLAAPAGVELGPVKVMLDDAALPGLAELTDRVRRAHEHGRRAAVHCVSAAQLVLALGAGVGPGDRIEHASIVPDSVVGLLASCGVTVVTQPGLIPARGDRYLAEVEPRETAALYRVAGLSRAGVPVAVGTDAPYGPADPWVHVGAAVDRRTASGVVVGDREEVDLRSALALLQRDPLEPHRRARALRVGEPADLCVLDATWSELSADPASVVMAGTWMSGEPLC